MPKSHALIVDDSKTAQVRLRKMLERYDLQVDTASSAEEALSYLSYQSPAVVFMDHHMEGMDGLEALRIMKSNPSTAMIPVIMYTSEKGDVYVGQARAMGALDILSKEVVKPANLAKVLSSLNIRPKDTVAADTNNVTPLQASGERAAGREANVAPAGGSAELQAVRSQIARLFEIHIADVRQQVADSTKFIVRRFSRDLEDRLAKLKADAEEVQPVEEARPEGNGASVLFSALILVGLVVLGFQVISSSREQRALAAQVERLRHLAEQQAVVLTELQPALAQGAGQAPGPTASAATNAAASFEPEALLQALSLAANFSPQFAYGHLALNDERATELAQLVGLLDIARYTGTLIVDVHFGNFCVVRAENGELVLPEPNATLAECQLLADLNLEFAVEDQLSLSFARFTQTQPALAQGKIKLQLRSRGLDRPRYRYPTPAQDLLAKEWNARAQRNNRLDLVFSGVTPEASGRVDI
jgi:CheY-like chemotaxis protein